MRPLLLLLFLFQTVLFGSCKSKAIEPQVPLRGKVQNISILAVSKELKNQVLAYIKIAKLICMAIKLDGVSISATIKAYSLGKAKNMIKPLGNFINSETTKGIYQRIVIAYTP
jgi:hypothetical protein